MSSSATRGDLVGRVFLRLGLAFFIVDALSARHKAGANDADGVCSLGKHNRDQPAPFCNADQNIPLFMKGVAWIVDDSAEWVAECSARFLERYVMLSDVRGCLARVPLEGQRHAVAWRRDSVFAASICGAPYRVGASAA